MGNAVIRPGEADAGLIAPLEGSPAGVALSVDCNPKYCRINPYWGSAAAVAEAMRNVAAIGATPYGMTDCLNFGNPQKPKAFNEFTEAIRGIANAARQICFKGTDQPVAFVSGNVSFYNESADGSAVDHSAIIACVGVMQDYSKAIRMNIKKQGTKLFMIGKRKDELGGSVYYDIHNELGKNLPQVEFEQEKNMIHCMIDLIDKRLLLSCHDISDGGIATTISEMILGGNAKGTIGAEIRFEDSLRADRSLFSETSGFVFEIKENNIKEAEKIAAGYKIDLTEIGQTKGNRLVISHNGKKIVDAEIEKLKQAWTSGLKEALS
jgi:phosphoribosylformylglycinamidine synthase